MKYTLRNYQKQASDAAVRLFTSKADKNGLIILPTGAGKSLVIAASRHIDLVLGGHSHSLFQTLKYRTDLDGKQVPVDQNGKGAIWVGKMTLDIVKNK